MLLPFLSISYEQNSECRITALQVQYHDDVQGLHHGIVSFVRKVAALAFIPIPFVTIAWRYGKV